MKKSLVAALQNIIKIWANTTDHQGLTWVSLWVTWTIEDAGSRGLLWNFGSKYTILLKYSLTCLDSIMTLSDIPFLIHRVYCDVSPAFAASTLLGRLSTRFRCVLMGILTFLPEAHLWGHPLMLVGKAWLSVSALIHPKGVLSGWGQDSVQASQVHPHQTL